MTSDRASPSHPTGCRSPRASDDAPPCRAASLRVDGLSVAYGQERRSCTTSDFAVGRGESVALIGESGSGKSTIAKTVLRLLPRRRDGARGSIRFRRSEAVGLPGTPVPAAAGTRARLRPAGPELRPQPRAHHRVAGARRPAALRRRRGDARRMRRARILEMFERVGLPDPKRVYDSYPHQLSGGMLQRVLIGLAVLPHPTLIVADEPTSALDVTIQKRILDLLSELRGDLGIGLLLITHDLAIAAERTDAIVVLKDGAVQEPAAAARRVRRPASDYTRSLRADVPALNPERYQRACAAIRVPIRPPTRADRGRSV